MLYRKFGKLIFKVSEISFGGAAISGEGGGYGFGEISLTESVALLRHAYDLGINLFDTAPVYGFGESEKRMGIAFQGMREKVFLVSKCGVSWHDNKRINIDNSPETVAEMLQQSLSDLQTDYIDLYMVHWPDPQVDIRATMEVLVRAQESGKIHHIGLCNTNQQELSKALEIGEIHVLQSEMNLFNSSAKQELFEPIQKYDFGFMTYGTLAKGILTGRVDKNRTFDKFDCRSWAPWWKSMDKESYYKAVKLLTSLLHDSPCSLLDIAVHFNLSNKEVSTVLCGARTPTQLDELVSSLDNRPSLDTMENVLTIVAAELNAKD